MTQKYNIRSLIEQMDGINYITGAEYKKNSHLYKDGNHAIYKYVEKTGSLMIWSKKSPAYKTNGLNIIQCAYDLVKKSLDTQEPYIYITEWGGDGKWYGARRMNVLVKNMKTDTECYEVLCGQRPRRLYADIEFECNDGEPDDKKKQLLIDAIKNFKKQINELCKDTTKPIYRTCTSMGVNHKDKYKYSAHIHVSNKYISFEKLDKFKGFLTQNGVAIDTSVYSKNQLFKFPYQLKRDDRNKGLFYRAQKPISKNLNAPLEDYIIQHIPEDCQCIDELLDEVKIMTYKKKNKDGKYPYKKMDIEVSSNELIVKSINRLTPYEIINCFDATAKCMCKEAYWRVMVYMRMMGMTYQQFLDKFNEPYKHLQENENHIKSWEAQWNKIQKEKTTIRLEAIINILKAQYPNFTQTDISDFLGGVVNEENFKGDMTLIPKEQEYIDSSIFSQILGDTKYLLLNGSLGSGKTRATLDYMEELLKQGGKKVIFICNRITLKVDVMGNIRRRGLDKYLYDYKTLNRGDVKLPETDHILMTTLESLYKFNVDNYDLVVIDEVESVYKTLLSYGTVKQQNYKYTCIKFIDLLKKAKNVFLLDGILMTRTYELIENIEGKANYHTIITENKNKQNRNIIYYKNNIQYVGCYAFINDLLNYIRDGKKAFLFMPHKTGKGAKNLEIGKQRQGVYLLKQLFLNHCSNLKENDVVIHCGSHKNNLKLFDVCAFWRDKKLVLTTSCITNGVSHDEKNVFDGIWILNDSSLVGNRDVAQVQARIRNPKDVSIRYCDLNTGGNSMSFTIPEFARGDFIAPNYQIIRRGNKYVNQEDPNKLYKKAITDLHKHLCIEHYSRDNVVCLKLLEKIGIVVDKTIISTEESMNDAKADLERTVQDIYEFTPFWEYKHIEDINEWTAEEYWFKDKGGQLDDENRYKLEKHLLHSRFHNKTDPKLLEDLWDRRRVVQGFYDLIFNGRHPIQYCFDFKDTRELFGIVIAKLKMMMKNKQDINQEWFCSQVVKKNTLSTLHHKALLGRVDTGSLKNCSGVQLVNKAIAQYFTPKYFHKGEFQDKMFYKDLLLFCQCYNPTAEVRLPYLRIQPYTTWITYEDGSKEQLYYDPHNNKWHDFFNYITEHRYKLGDYDTTKKCDINELPDKYCRAKLSVRNWGDDSIEVYDVDDFRDRCDEACMKQDTYSPDGGYYYHWTVPGNLFRKYFSYTKRYKKHLIIQADKQRNKALRRGECNIDISSDEEDED